MEADGEYTIETSTMADAFAGEQGVITKIGVSICELSTNIYTWGLYAIEPVDMDVIKYPMIL